MRGRLQITLSTALSLRAEHCRYFPRNPFLSLTSDGDLEGQQEHGHAPRQPADGEAHRHRGGHAKALPLGLGEQHDLVGDPHQRGRVHLVRGVVPGCGGRVVGGRLGDCVGVEGRGRRVAEGARDRGGRLDRAAAWENLRGKGYFSFCTALSCTGSSKETASRTKGFWKSDGSAR